MKRKTKIAKPALAPSSKKLSDTLSACELAQLLHVSLQHLSWLAAQGRVVRASYGKYKFKESVQAYCNWLNHAHPPTDPNSPKGRREEALARKAEVKVRQMEAGSIPMDEAISTYRDHVASARQVLLQLPGRVPPEAIAMTREAVAAALEELEQTPDTLRQEIEASGRAGEAGF